MISSKVRDVMEEKGVTVREVMEQTGLAKETVNRARGPMIARCTLETLAAIAAALGVKVKELFEEG
jgi:DNA-binding Xre family transcriptional regulator